MKVSILPVAGIPKVQPNSDLPSILFSALDANGPALAHGDILVVCQKIVSKAEGRLVDLRSVTPSPLALRIAAATEDKDPRVIEVALRQTRRIVRMERGHLIVETGPGWVCANAGVDESNSGDPNLVVLLPVDPDASAKRLVAAAQSRYGCRIAAIVSDTFGRPWRQGQVDFALGVAGMRPLLDLRGSTDIEGRQLRHTVIASADALAAAAGLVMGKDAGVPAALIRGYPFAPGEGAGTDILRPREFDLFR